MKSYKAKTYFLLICWFLTGFGHLRCWLVSGPPWEVSFVNKQILKVTSSEERCLQPWRSRNPSLSQNLPPMLQPSEILRRSFKLCMFCMWVWICITYCTLYIVRQYVIIIYSGISAGVPVCVCGSQKDLSEVDGMSWNSAVWFQAGQEI